MSPAFAGIAGIGLFLFLIACKMPISYSMALVGIAGFAILTGPSAAFSMAATELYSTFSSYSLSVIPMFVWMGFLAYYSGIGIRLYRFAYSLMGHMPGGLAIATQAACAIFGAICGSNTATAATMGAITLPEMRKYRYHDSLSTASVAAGGALGVLIPPSVIFIVYGVATEQSIGRLFVAGIVPGIILMLAYMLAIYIMAKRNPLLAPPGRRADRAEAVRAFLDGILEVAVVFIVSLGGLFWGWFTPTEAGAVGAASVLLVTLIRRQLTYEAFKKSLLDTTRTTAMIMLMVAGAMIFGRFIAVSRLPFELATWAAQLTFPPFVVMAIVLLVYALLGCFIDALALVLLTTPIFYPVVVTTLGYDPIWFGVVVVLVVALGVITPPVGMNVYIIKGVAPDVPLETIFKGVWPFVIALALCILFFIAFPPIVTFVPDLFYGAGN